MHQPKLVPGRSSRRGCHWQYWQLAAGRRRLLLPRRGSAADAAPLRRHAPSGSFCTASATAAAASASATPSASSAAAPGGGSGGAPYRLVRGMRDMFPPESRRMAFLRAQGEEAAELAGYAPVATPLLEQVGVFTHALGTTSDVVTKEMYTLEDRRGSTLCMRPENTAGLARAFGSSPLSQPHELPRRFYYHGPMFRYERPQKGRYRQFEQFGVERFDRASGSTDDDSSVARDADIVGLAAHYLAAVGVLGSVELQVNFLGDTDARRNFGNALSEYLHPQRAKLSNVSQNRLDRGSVLRILDSKLDSDLAILAQPDAPVLADYLDAASRCRADATVEAIKAVVADFQCAGSIDVLVNPRLVRGLDYYTDTVFEFVPRAGTTGVGTQSTVLAGGSYGHLVSELGGPPGVVGAGWSAGLDRLALLLEAVNPASCAMADAAPSHMAIIPMGDDTRTSSLAIAQRLRVHKVASVCYVEGPVKKRLKRAVSMGASHAVFVDASLGASVPLHDGIQIRAKELATGRQMDVSLSDLVEDARRWVTGELAFCHID